jgi:hypothetical protein
MKHKITLLHTDLCPCRSGWMIASCCLDESDRKLRKRVPSVRPPGPQTNHSHSDCYLGRTSDCSREISREHYVSASVLEQLGDIIDVSGVPWLGKGESQKLAVNNLTAKILCKRHNESLSPLDQEAGIFFSVLAKALSDLERKSSSRKPNFHLVSGTMLELWMLKVACGAYFSVAANDGKRLTETHAIDLAKIERSLFLGHWDDRGGLYFTGHVGSAMTTESRVVLISLTDNSAMKFCGIRISLLGLTMEILFDTAGANSEPWTGLTRRPTELIFERAGREHHIILTWPSGTPEASVRLADEPPS